MSDPQVREENRTTRSKALVDTVEIRPAYLGDAAVIADIYNEGIEDRTATLETELRDAAERLAWLKQRGARHPVVVAERNGVVLGWGSLNPFSERPAYRHVADLSVYVAREHRGKGVGRRLLEALIERAGPLDYHKLVLAMFPWNTEGMALYKKHGFREVGTYKEQGRLDGKWVDTLIMEKLLD